MFTVIVGQKYCLLHGDEQATEFNTSSSLKTNMKHLGWEEGEPFEVSLINTKVTQEKVKEMASRFGMKYQRGKFHPAEKISWYAPKERKKRKASKKPKERKKRNPFIGFGRAGGSYDNLGDGLNRVISHIDENTPSFETWVEEEMRLVSLSSQWGRGTTKTCLRSLWREFWCIAGRNIVNSDRYKELFYRPEILEVLGRMQTLEDLYKEASDTLEKKDLFKIYAMRHIIGVPND